MAAVAVERFVAVHYPIDYNTVSLPRKQCAEFVRGLSVVCTKAVQCEPNKPDCAQFASILRLLLIGAISTQPCYVSTLCVDIALIIRVCKFSQIWRMRRRMRRICAKKHKKEICVRKKNERKYSDPRLEPGISYYKSATVTTRLPCLPGERKKQNHYINTEAQFWRNFRAISAHASTQLRENCANWIKKVLIAN